jgi:Protein of unknown function (DUF3060)
MNLRRLSAVIMIIALCALGFASTLPRQSAASIQAKAITFDKDDQTTTIDCKSSAVTINGDDNHLTLTGECSKLTVDGDDNTIKAAAVIELAVSGDDNTIAVETAGKIDTSGDDSKVTWTKGFGGKAPVISNTGDDNVTKQSRN